MAGLVPAEALDRLRRSLALIPAHEPSRTPVRIILAVSGGPDSLALLWSAAAHSRTLERQGFRFHVVTVDHALRPASAGEAEHVGALARRLGLPHEVRRWTGDKPGSNLQGEARRARYDLLAEAARAIGAAAVMTAHHDDDQIETHLLAAARKAGDRGLSGMRPVRDLAPGLVLLRPFLDVPGAWLKAATAAAGLAAIDDPSNRDERFDRVRLRKAVAAGAIDRAAILARIAIHAARRGEADRRVAECLAALRADGRIAVDATGILSLDGASFAGIGEGTAIDILDRILPAVGGTAYPPPRAAVERLRDGLFGTASERLFRTLGGVRVERGAAITFSREFGRTGPRSVQVRPGSRHALFDGRFDLDLSGLAPAAGMSVLAPLGRIGVGNAHERTLPVLFGEGGEAIAAPAAILHKLASSVRPLRLFERVSWRLWADLSRPTGAR